MKTILCKKLCWLIQISCQAVEMWRKCLQITQHHPGHGSYTKTEVRSFTSFQINKCNFIPSRIFLLKPWSKAGAPQTDSAVNSARAKPCAGSRTKCRNKGLGLSSDFTGGSGQGTRSSGSAPCTVC